MKFFCPNSVENRSQLRRSGACAIALLLGMAAVSWGGAESELTYRGRRIAPRYDGIVSPLYVGNSVPVLDQFGRPMKGSNRSAEAANRSVVEIRLAPRGIRPPAATGAPHEENPLATPTSVGGMGMNTAYTNDSGLFAMVFPNRLPAGTKIFARVYNAAKVSEASFYADSSIVVVRSNATSVVLAFGAAQPLDTGDADGDGLNNSWEKALGTDGHATPDFDEDGVCDRDEQAAGTDPRDDASHFKLNAIGRDTGMAKTAAGGSAMLVRFQSVPGKRYQVEFAGTLAGEQTFEAVGEVVTAEPGETQIEMEMTIPDGYSSGIFRVKKLQ